MDDTTATPPTTATASAAAVAADGATSAAVNLKNAATTTTNTSVKLLIKASNQQYDDQIIESDLLWTVRRLKTHLSSVYPSKPPAAEQKLIYSGQLLNDCTQLKDIIRSYKDVYTQNHIIHLVYIPKSLTTAKTTAKTPATQQATNMSATTDGLRQRHVGAAGINANGNAATAAQQQQQQQQFMQFASTQYGMPATNMMSPMLAAAYMQQMQHPTPQMALSATCMPTDINALNPIAAQQMAVYNAWMQQVYTQYMEQYARLSSAAGASGVASTATAGQGSDQLAAMQAYLQQMRLMTYPSATTVIPTTTMMSAFPNIASATATNNAVNTQIPNAVVNEQQQQQEQQQPEAAAAAQQRRFPNIVHDDQENRDWLDSFFSITRLAIFLTILYFNSSPLRCFIVLVIGSVIYLYHIGVIRFRHERNNNNINRNNNAAAAADAEQIRQGVQQVQAAQQQQQQQEQQQPANNPPNANEPDIAAAADAVDNANVANAAAATDTLLTSNNANNNEQANELEPDDPENTSVISFVRTFVVTFFTSLFPETPAL